MATVLERYTYRTYTIDVLSSGYTGFIARIYSDTTEPPVHSVNGDNFHGTVERAREWVDLGIDGPTAPPVDPVDPVDPPTTPGSGLMGARVSLTGHGFTTLQALCFNDDDEWELAGARIGKPAMVICERIDDDNFYALTAGVITVTHGIASRGQRWLHNDNGRSRIRAPGPLDDIRQRLFIVATATQVIVNIGDPSL